MSARLRAVAVLLAACAVAPRAAAASPHWQEPFPWPGIAGRVAATVTLRDTLYAGGVFDRIGETATGAVAAFDGTRWSAVTPPLPEEVTALGVWRGQVVAATHRFGLDPSRVSRVWRRDGAGWTPLGDSLPGQIGRIVAFGDSLVAAGSAVRGVPSGSLPLYIWDGASWHADVDTLTGDVAALAVYRGRLYAGGLFAGPSRVRVGVARLGVSGWEPQPLVTSCRDLAVAQDRLWSLGDLGLPGSNSFDVALDRVASFDGTTWQGAGLETIRGHGYRLPVPQGGLLATGDSLFVALPTGLVLRTPAGEWRSLLAKSPDFTNSDFQLQWLRGALYLGPWYGRASIEALVRVRFPAGASDAQVEIFDPITAIGSLNLITGLAVHDGLLFVQPGFADPVIVDGHGSRAIDGEGLVSRDAARRGSFTDIDGTLYAAWRDYAPATYGMSSDVAVWSGASGTGDDPAWRALVPAGAASPPLKGEATEFVAWDGALVVGGAFVLGPRVGANVVRLDGTTWRALGGDFDDTVYSLCVYRGALYAGGRFTAVGGTPRSHIARWDGAAWQDVGGGIDGDVEVMRVYGDRLIVGGRFTAAGGAPASSIVAWDGAGWTTLRGGTISGRVWSLADYDGDLIAGGSMLLTTPRDATFGIGRWHDGAWHSMDGGLDGSVYALAVYGSALYAAGEFKNSLGGYTGVLRVWNDDPARGVDGFAPSVQVSGGASLRGGVRVSYFLPRPGPARLVALDARGRRVATLDDGPRDTGQHTVVWDPHTTMGDQAASGVYTIALVAGGRTHARRVVWLR